MALLRRLPGSGSDDALAEQKPRNGLWVNVMQEWAYRIRVGILMTIDHSSDNLTILFDLVELALYAREYDLAFDMMSLVTAPSGKLHRQPHPDLLKQLMASLLLNGDPEVLPRVRQTLSLLPRIEDDRYCARVWDMAADRGNLAVIRELLSPEFEWYMWQGDHMLHQRLLVASSPDLVETLSALALTKLPFRDHWDQALRYPIFFTADWEGTPPSLNMNLAENEVQFSIGGGKPVDLSPHWAEFGRRVRDVVADTQRRCGLAVLGAVLHGGDPAVVALEAIARTVQSTGSTMDAEMGRAAEVSGPERVQRRLVSLGNPRPLEALWRVAPSVLRLDRVAAIAAEWGFPDVQAWAEEKAAHPDGVPLSDPREFAVTLLTGWSSAAVSSAC